MTHSKITRKSVCFTECYCVFRWGFNDTVAREGTFVSQPFGTPFPRSAYQFELMTEEALVLVKPFHKTELVEPVEESQHEPVESSVEPVPVVADVQADPQSPRTSVAPS